MKRKWINRLFIAALMFFGTIQCSGLSRDSRNVPNNVPPPASIQSVAIVDKDYIGAFPSLVIDPEGRLHGSYYVKRDRKLPGAGALSYATLEGGVWNHAFVDGDIYSADASDVDVGQFSRMVVDSKGTLHISYWDTINKELKYGKLFPGEGQSWIIETLPQLSPQTAMCTTHASLMVGAMGPVYIGGYCAEDSPLSYLTNKSGMWVQESIAPDDVYSRLSLQLDSLGKIHVAFFDFPNKNIMYGTQSSTGWKIEEVTTLMSSDTVIMNLVLDHANRPHIVYYDTENEQLKHATQSPGWAIHVVDRVGDPLDSTLKYPDATQISSLVDRSNRLHVSYFDGANHDLRHAVLEEGNWEVWTIDTGGSAGDVGQSSAMAEDENGWIHIIYRDSTNDQLKYVYMQ